MATSAAISEPQLPWVDHGEDRGFKWLMIVLLVVSLGAGAGLNMITLPEVEQKNLVDVSPRLAKLILEKQKVKPPPPPKKEPPKEEKKKEPEKKKEEPKKPEPKKEPEKKKEVKKETAREVAKKSGLIALSDELADLRESFDLDSVAAVPQQTSAGKQAAVVATSSDLLSSSATATQSSGGIETNTLTRKIETSELAQRQTAKVESKIESDEQLAKASQPKQSGSGGGSAGRTSDEVERVFQKYRGKIDSLYNRALRKNPMLQGKVVIELTVAPGGQVVSARIVSSELGDEALERKLLLSIKKFQFPSSSAAQTTITYPIDFLPS